jgi:hypothetical protein
MYYHFYYNVIASVHKTAVVIFKNFLLTHGAESMENSARHQISKLSKYLTRRPLDSALQSQAFQN